MEENNINGKKMVEKTRCVGSTWDLSNFQFSNGFKKLSHNNDLSHTME